MCKKYIRNNFSLAPSCALLLLVIMAPGTLRATAGATTNIPGVRSSVQARDVWKQKISMCQPTGDSRQQCDDNSDLITQAIDELYRENAKPAAQANYQKVQTLIFGINLGSISPRHLNELKSLIHLRHQELEGIRTAVGNEHNAKSPPEAIENSISILGRLTKLLDGITSK